MKKLALLLGIFTISIFFYSCNADREESVYNGPQPETIYPAPKLLKITERVFVDNDTLPQDTLSTVETHFTYNNIGQLTETDNGIVRNEISYSGTKKVSNVETYKGSGLTTNQFNYSGDKLVNVIGTGTEAGKTIYNFSADGKISSKDDFKLENNAFVKKRSVVYTYSGDNATTENEANYTLTDTINTRNDFTFDEKTNPFAFLNQYLKLFNGFEEYAPFNFNDKLTSSSIDADDPNAVPVKYTYSVTVNSINSPTSIKMINEDGFAVKEWIFEYVTETPAP